jgi:hypothetical protein
MSAGGPEAVLWDALRGALVTRALALAADLRIAHALSGGPRGVDELARDTGADADTLDRILRALASDGIFAETAPGVFQNTAVSDLLRTDGWDDFAHLFGGVWLRALAGLDASGAPSFPRLHGTGFWEWLAAHPEERAAFDRAMEQGWQGRVERLDSVGWRGDESLGRRRLRPLDRAPQLGRRVGPAHFARRARRGAGRSAARAARVDGRARQRARWREVA